MPTRLSSLPHWRKWWLPTLPLKHWKTVRLRQAKCWLFPMLHGKSKVRACSSILKFLSASAPWLRVQPSSQPTMPPLPLPKPLATALSMNSSNKWTKKPNAWAWSTPTSTTRPVFLLTAMFQPLATLPSWLPRSSMTIRNIILYLQTNLSNTIISSSPTAISCSIATAVSTVWKPAIAKAQAIILPLPANATTAVLYPFLPVPNPPKRAPAKAANCSTGHCRHLIRLNFTTAEKWFPKSKFTKAAPKP